MWIASFFRKTVADPLDAWGTELPKNAMPTYAAINGELHCQSLYYFTRSFRSSKLRPQCIRAAVATFSNYGI